MSRLFRIGAFLAMVVTTVPGCVEFGSPDHGARVVQLDWNVVSAGDSLCGPVREIEVRFHGLPGQTQIHAVDCEDARAVFASIPEHFEHVTVVAIGDDGLELDRTSAALGEGSEVSLSVDILR